MEHEVWIGIGSNAGAETTLPQARQLLTKAFGSIAFSTPLQTAPVDFSFSAPFTNQVARFRTALTADEVNAKLKDIERTCGRRPEDKAQGRIRIDLDLLQYGSTVVKKNDFSRAYIRQGINELNAK